MAIGLVFFSHWFVPEPGAKGLVFVRELIRQGFEVEVVSGFPNSPIGEVYPGYRIRLLQREIIDGLHIARLPLYPDHRHSAIRRIFDYASFAASSLVHCLFSWGARM
jgi:colanic acid biosynthesis glycosyl transferase WcaI